MPLDLLHEKLGKTILKHYQEGKLFATKKYPSESEEKLGLDESEPICVWDEYKDADKNGTLVYEPEEFTENHNSKTKQEIIAQGGTWQISFFENLPNLPKENEGKPIKGRKQVEAGKSAIKYLELLQTKPMYANEHGIAPEDWATYFLRHLEETNQVIDDWLGKGKDSWNLGAFFPGCSLVPEAYWDGITQQAHMNGATVVSSVGIGARTCVRV
jgi:hypothetical protein